MHTQAHFFEWLEQQDVFGSGKPHFGSTDWVEPAVISGVDPHEIAAITDYQGQTDALVDYGRQLYEAGHHERMATLSNLAMIALMHYSDHDIDAMARRWWTVARV